MKLIEEKDKLNQITEESLKNNRNIMPKSNRTSLELIKYFQIERIKIKNQQEGRFIPSGKVYMIQKGSDLVFVPRPAVHKHCNPWRIFRVDSKYLRKDEILTLEIPKYRRLKMRENYFTKIEIFISQIPTRIHTTTTSSTTTITAITTITAADTAATSATTNTATTIEKAMSAVVTLVEAAVESVYRKK